MKKSIIAAVLLAAVCMSASAKKEKKEILFGVKSGIITISTDMEMPDFGDFGGMMGGAMPEGMGDWGNFNMNDMTETIYFDDYGRKTVSVTKNGDRVTRTVEIGDSTYTINETANTATAMPIFGGRGGRGFGMGWGGGASVGTLGQIDWMNLDKKTIRRNKIKEAGEETVAGVSCKKYTMSPSNTMGMTTTTTLCVYKGIVLSTETLSEWNTTPTVQTAVKFEENAQIPESMFQLPEGCKIEQRNWGGMGDWGGMGGFGGGDWGGFGGGGMGGFGGGMMF